MITLNELIRTELDDLEEELGIVFAFNDEQFNQECKKDTTYVALGGGTYCPVKNTKEFLRRAGKITRAGIELDKELHTVEQIVIREMKNYELITFNSIEVLLDVLKGYDFEEEQIIEIFKSNLLCLN